MIFQGLHYQSRAAYGLVDLLKRGRERNLRFHLAAQYVRPGEQVLDVCAGTGKFRSFIPRDCSYIALEASEGFLAHLERLGTRVIAHDFHAGWPGGIPRADAVVMIISLAHFRDTSVATLLERFKTAGRRVIIVEELSFSPRGPASVHRRAFNYLSAAPYHRPIGSWYTRREFEDLMVRHGYRYRTVNEHYSVGLYGDVHA